MRDFLSYYLFVGKGLAPPFTGYAGQSGYTKASSKERVPDFIPYNGKEAKPGIKSYLGGYDMRKLFFVSLIISVVIVCGLLVSVVGAQDTWVTANQVTVAWDPVTTLINGDPVPAGDTITYNVYIKDMVTSTQTAVATGLSSTTFTITLASEGRYLVGVSAVRNPQGTAEEIESVIGWSDNPVIASSGTFGVQMFNAPKSPVGLTPQ